MSHPTNNDLKYAGAELTIDRLHAELDAKLPRTWRGRLALRLSHRIARRRNR